MESLIIAMIIKLLVDCFPYLFYWGRLLARVKFFASSLTRSQLGDDNLVNYSSPSLKANLMRLYHLAQQKKDVKLVGANRADENAKSFPLRSNLVQGQLP